MAFNLGVQNKKPAVADGPTPGMEELFDAYMEVESVSRATKVFLQHGQFVEDSFENLCIIGRALAKHPSAEGLATVRDIVRDELGAPVSMEVLSTAARTALDAVLNFLAKILAWIKSFFSKIFNFMVRAEKRLDKAIERVREMPDGADIQWTYRGIRITARRGDDVEETIKALTDPEVDLNSREEKEFRNSYYAYATLGSVPVRGKQETLATLTGAKQLFKDIDRLKTAITKRYNDSKEAVKKTGSDENAAELKEIQKRMRAAVSVVDKMCSVYSSTIASIIINAPKKPINTK